MGGCISSVTIWLRDKAAPNLGLATATFVIAATTAIMVATAIAILTTLVTLFTTLLFVFLGYWLFLWATGRQMSCPCSAGAINPTSPLLQGGYKPTKRNLKYLRRYKAGKSIGFTMRSSLKAKGLIPRANGTLRVSQKYRTKQKDVRSTRRRSQRR
jgi:hypothetical protein